MGDVMSPFDIQLNSSSDKASIATCLLMQFIANRQCWSVASGMLLQLARWNHLHSNASFWKNQIMSCFFTSKIFLYLFQLLLSDKQWWCYFQPLWPYCEVCSGRCREWPRFTSSLHVNFCCIAIFITSYVHFLKYISISTIHISISREH